MDRRKLIILGLGLLAVVLVGAYALSEHRGTPASTAAVGGPFQLVDVNGRATDESVLKGKWSAVFFGFTYCPDACPTALGVMSAALDKLDVAAERVVPILITVDPERDTPPVLKDYVSNFHPRMVGLTGTPEQIAQVAKAYRVYYQKAAGATGGDYLMDHTLLIYLMDGEGKYLANFSASATPDDIAAKIREHL